MVGIIILVILGIILWSAFTTPIDKGMDNMGMSEEEKDSAWWTIGMLADMHNKRNKK